MLGHLLLFLFSFVGIWIGSGLAVSSVEKLSRSLKLSSFAVSFLVLGIFTSISEMSVGANALLEHDPEIFVGNLIGASIVIFLLIIPLLVIFGNRVKVNPELRGFNLAMSSVVVAIPVVLSFDGQIDKLDGWLAIILYLLLVMIVEQKRGLFDELSSLVSFSRKSILKLLAKILAGVIIIFGASHFIVQQTLYFSGIIGLSPFLLSLLFIAIGTNLPELSFLARSLFAKNHQVAFGDYVGSASFNTGLFGVFTLLTPATINLSNSYLVSLLFLIVGLILFYLFARSGNVLKRSEGIILLVIYLLFVIFEIYLHPLK